MVYNQIKHDKITLKKTLLNHCIFNNKSQLSTWGPWVKMKIARPPWLTQTQLACIQTILSKAVVGVAVEVVDPAVGRLLVVVVDDRVDLPGERWIRAPLAMVVAGLGQVPEVVDH